MDFRKKFRIKKFEIEKFRVFFYLGSPFRIPVEKSSRFEIADFFSLRSVIPPSGRTCKLSKIGRWSSSRFPLSVHFSSINIWLIYSNIPEDYLGWSWTIYKFISHQNLKSYFLQENFKHNFKEDLSNIFLPIVYPLPSIFIWYFF